MQRVDRALKFYDYENPITKDRLDLPTFLVEHLVPSDGTVLFSGATSSGKSAFVWTMLNAIEQGLPFLGLQTRKARCLYLCLDMSATQLAKRWIAGGFVPRFTHICEEPFNILSPIFHEEEQALCSTLPLVVQEKGIELIVVDALGETLQGDLISDSTPRLLYGNFRRWLPGKTVLFIHHTRKQKHTSEGRVIPMSGEDASGNNFFRNFATVAFYLVRAADHASLHMDKSQVGPLIEPISLFVAENGGTVELWDENAQRRDAARYDQGVRYFMGTVPGWDQKTITERTKDLAKYFEKSTKTIRRWASAYEKGKPSKGKIKTLKEAA